MLGFLSVAFLIYGGMHLYAFTKVWQAFQPSTPLGLALALLAIVLTLSPFILWYIARRNWHSVTVVLSWMVYVWMGFILLFCVVAFAFDFGNTMLVLLGFKWPLGRFQALLTSGLLAVALTGYGFYDARQIRIERISLSTPKLRTGRVTIAQISDLHLGVMLGDAFLDRILRKLCKAKPDIVAATGDIVDGEGNNLNLLAQRFHECTPPKGKFAVLGNHEYYAGLEGSLRFLRDAGFTVLRGEAAEAGGIVLAGVDDPSGLSLGEETKLTVDATLKTAPKDAFIILLKHQPVVDLGTPFDLQLSGHVHGGQIFPFNIFTRLVYRVRTGLTRLAAGRWLYVSRGAGTWGPPIRLLAPPEITLITIEAEKPGEPPPA
jgi:predicted MPP superfamily phosphohydrolase